MSKYSLKVGTLFRPGVSSINREYTGGHQRIFLQDLKIFQRNKIDFKAFCHAKITPGHPKIKSLPYLSSLKKKAHKISSLKVNFPLKGRVAFWLDFFAEFCYSLSFFLKSLDCDILISHQSAVLALIDPKRTIISVHINGQHLPLGRILKKRYQKANFLFCSKSLQKNFEKLNSIKLLNSKVIYNAVDTTLFRYKGKKKKLGKKAPFRLLYCSAWDKQKGLHLLLKAIINLQTKGLKNIHLVVASNQKLWSNFLGKKNFLYLKKITALFKKIKSLELKNGVLYQNIPALYQKCDCLIFPSTGNESFGLVNIEAMACGTPVIAFNVGAIPEIIDQDNSGFILSEIREKKLADKIKSLSKNRQKIKKMGKKARKVVEQKFSLKHREKKLISFLNDCLLKKVES